MNNFVLISKFLKMARAIVLALALILLIDFSAYTQDNKNSVFYTTSGRKHQWITTLDNHKALYNIIFSEACDLLNERKEYISTLSREGDWKRYQQEAKAKLCSSLDKFQKTPLNSKITGKLERETFTVEKILFESHHDFFVTAAMFIPKNRQNPAPAVIYVCGHTDLGFRSEGYQHVILNLVNKGFIVFAVDPIGQGERFQYPDPETGKSKVGGSTKEHSYAGVQTLLTGSSLSDYFIWDGIRSLDYLETRKEVDMKRIGITGRSGGGTQTAMIAASDERIYASAPECYITNFKRLLQSIGPQDAEQNPYNAIAKKFDHPDFIHIRAPKPTLIVTTTHDFFSIQGARETFAEAKKSYTALGKPENLEMTEDLGVHESTKKNRETVYAFFQKHLNLPGDNTDEEIPPFTVEELFVTPTGQIGTSYEGVTVYDLNKIYFKGKNFSERYIKKNIAETAGIDFSRKLTASVYTGKLTPNEDYIVEKYFLENDRNDFLLPVYVAKKEINAPVEKAVIWLHPQGKETILQQSLLSKLINSGFAVISADMPGTGELHDPEFSGDGVIKGVPFNYTFGANLAGKSITGIKAEAFDLLIQFTNKDDRFKNAELFALAQGTTISEIIHYAMLRNPFQKIAVADPPVTAEDIIDTEYYDATQAFSKVPGCLNYYDLPDLMAQLPSGSIKTCVNNDSGNEDINIDSNSAKEIITFFNKK
jgi:cephalosporin-C deacetylase-like acetyl esterase